VARPCRSPISDEAIVAALLPHVRADGSISGASWCEITAELGQARQTIECCAVRLRRAGLLPRIDTAKRAEARREGATSEVRLTPDEIRAACAVELARRWEMRGSLASWAKYRKAGDESKGSVAGEEMLTGVALWRREYRRWVAARRRGRERVMSPSYVRARTYTTWCRGELAVAQ
jgi:hypothetical protein